MRRGVWLLLPWVVGCTFEDRPRSLVESLWVLSAVVEPPEVAFTTFDLYSPSSAVGKVPLGVTLLVADPLRPAVELDVAVVACTNYGGECLESLQYTTLGGAYVDEGGALTEAAWRDWLTFHAWRGRASLSGGVAEVKAQLRSFEGYAWLLDEWNTADLEARLTVLVCPVGRCEVFDAWDTYAQQEEATGGEEIFARLAFPEQATAGIPLGDVFFSTRGYHLTMDNPSPNDNPPMGGLYDPTREGGPPPSPTPGGEVAVAVNFPPEAFETVYTTAGSIQAERVWVSFFSTSGIIDPSAVEVSPEQPTAEVRWVGAQVGEVGLFAVARDSRDGQSFTWTRVVVE